jgi:hypothetical protein
MNRRTFLQYQPPLNVLFVLMDDMGWHDLTPYGNSLIGTPNVARFATESARFTNAYAACPVCSPTHGRRRATDCVTFPALVEHRSDEACCNGRNRSESG